MGNWRQIGDAPGLSGPPDPEPTIREDETALIDLFCENEIPDYLAEILADLVCHSFSDAAMARAKEALQDKLTPMIDKADDEAAAARRAGPDIEPDDVEPWDD